MAIHCPFCESESTKVKQPVYDECENEIIRKCVCNECGKSFFTGEFILEETDEMISVYHALYAERQKKYKENRNRNKM